MPGPLFDLDEPHSSPVLCAVLIAVYNQLVDQDQALARQMAVDLPAFRRARRPLDPLPGRRRP